METKLTSHFRLDGSSAAFPTWTPERVMSTKTRRRMVRPVIAMILSKRGVTDLAVDRLILSEKPPAHTDRSGLLPGVLHGIEFGFRSTAIPAITRLIIQAQRFRTQLQPG